VAVLVALLFLTDGARAASVGPAGYTNAFSSQPSSADWATFTRTGVATDVYDMDADVNANVTASGTTSQPGGTSSDPPSASGTATWSTAGYLQTRPTGVRYVPLMAKFVNNTGSNASQITFSYDFTIALGGVSEEVGMGTRVYYSLTGLANSWTNLPALNTTASANGRTNLSATLNLNWAVGASLFLLWVDDNSSTSGTDAGDQIDNFSLRVTPALACALTGPNNNAAFPSGAPILLAATVANGTMPYTVEYFTNAGAGNTLFASAGSISTPPFNLTLDPLPLGAYRVFAVATDSAGNPASASSATNTFFVADAMVLTLTAPLDDTTVDYTTPVTAAVMVSGGTAPYVVQFYLDNHANGAPVTSAPYERNMGPLFVGDHTIGALVADAHGWVSNSSIHTVHVTGPLGVNLVAPTNGASYRFGQSIILDAAAGGGTGPYTVTFYTNSQVVGTLTSPPFTTNLGLLPVGIYTTYVQITDSSSPTPGATNSTPSFFVVQSNPLTTSLTSPINGQVVAPGLPFTLAATASVLAPLTISNVEFFLDGVSVGIDSASPYTASVSAAVGSHAVYAAVTDSLGRKNYSATNQVTATGDPLSPNNNFVNAIPLTGLFVATNGNNLGATRESGEPFISGLPGGASVWWTWTSPDTGTAYIDTFGSSFDTLLGVYTGSSVSSLSTIATSDNYTNLQSRVSFTANAGTVYRIVVDGYNGAQGGIVLHIQGPNGLSISSPTNGAVFTVGDAIPFAVSFNANFPNQPVTQVDFYRAGVRFASSTNAPFTAVNTNSVVGSNTFYIIAYDSTGRGYQSGNRIIFVQNLGVTLISPTDGNYYLNPTSIPVTASTYLPVGVITNVEFFVDGIKFGQDSTAPYSAVWTNIPPGAHRFTAVGTSDSGVAYNSNPLYIGVYATFLPIGSIWKYLDNGSNQGTNWTARTFDDSSWAGGPSPLGYNNPQGRKLGTTNSFGPDPNNKYITTYYRQAVVITNVASYQYLEPIIQRDDGIVVYLNGVEIFRNNMPSGTITYTTLASTAASDDGQNSYGVIPSQSLFFEGTNVLSAEVHQNAANTPDCWFELYMYGIPTINRNQSPVVALTSPTNGFFALAPDSLTLEATASDSDGSITRVQFFSDGVKVGETNNLPYTIAWNNPPIGVHTLTAVATDNQGATNASAPVQIVVYDSVGAPIAQITNLLNGALMEGPTNLLVSAMARAIDGVTNVQFLANGIPFADASTAPYSAIWPSSFLSNGLSVVASDINGVSGTSAVVSVFITIPPTNTVAPFIATQVPLRGLTLTNFTNLVVVFSENVQHVDAGDLLVSGIPATGVTGSGSNYVFTFPQPPYGEAEIAWANGHGITDYGWPTVLPFNELSPDAQWEYQLIDRTPPIITVRTPARGSIVSNLTQISVTFSEPVTGVDGPDLLVNGTPALDVTGSGSNYTFSVLPQPAGTVNITWAAANGIFDQSDIPNAFVGGYASNVWSFTIDKRVVLVQSNSNWRFVKGFAEASTPSSAWRQLGFDDSSWSNSQAPFFYGDPYTNFPAGIFGTQLTDMRSNYSTIFLRQNFVVNGRGAITDLVINHQSDDGFIAWLNGVEVWRYNVPSGDLAYNATAVGAVNEPNGVGAAYIVATLTNSAVSRLVDGTNTLAIMALNQFRTDSDFGFNAQLYYYPVDTSTVPPRLLGADPPPGDIFYLTNVTITFSEGVSGVDASDLLINGIPATDVSSTTNTTYTFSFPQPPYGPILLTWDSDHGIADFDNPPKAFDGNAASSMVSYTLLNPSSPRIISQTPLANTTITGLTSITMTFTEPVTGVDASDLLFSGSPSSSVNSADGVTYTFSFAQPPFGTVTVRWAANQNITDIEVPPAAFDPTRFGGQWNYTLIDPVPSVTLTSPTNNAYVLAPANVPLRATASDNDGTINLVEFYQDSNKVGEATNSPYALTVSNVQQGVYVYRAVATDNTGLRGTSAPVVLNLVTSLPVALVRGPYLQIGSPTGAVIRWRSDRNSDSAVFYGLDPTSLTTVVSLSQQTTEHIVTLSGLQPDTRYYYSIGSAAQRLVGNSGVGSDYWFKTSPLVGTQKPTRFWVLGDCGTANDNARAVRDSYYNFAVTNAPADFWLMLGDNAYNSGLDTEYQSAVFDMYPNTLRNLFLWPTIGNHESNQSYTSEDYPYLNIFSLPHNGEAGGLPSGTQKYYSFDYANIHFISLDSMTSGRTADTPMAQWLVNDLNGTMQQWVIVFFHHPPYTRGNHNSDNETDLIEIRQNILPILESHGVDLVLCGHSHALERSYLLNGHYGFSSTLTSSMKIDGGDGREDGTGVYRKNSLGQGVVYSVSGSSGQITGGSLDHPAHYLSLNVLGSLVVDVNHGRLDVKFLGTGGTVYDHYSLVKDQPAIPPANVFASVIDANTVSLDWADLTANEIGYIVERSIDGATFAAIATNAVDSTNALDTGLSPNTTYFYRVRALDIVRASSPSPVASVTTVADVAVPLAPSGLIGNRGSGGSQIVLHWLDHSDNEAGFLIERSIDGGAFVPVASVAANINYCVDGNLAVASTYSYRVRSFNSAGSSAPANLGESQTLPQDNTVLLGGTATFHAGGAGNPPTLYEWRFRDYPIPGATNESLTISNAQMTDEGPYTVLVSDGLSAPVSNPAWLFVLAPPLIVESPTSRTNLFGSTANFHVTANGVAPLVYQWRKDGVNLPGASTEQLTISSAAIADQANYDVLVVNSLGAVTSQVARLVVNRPPVAAADHLLGFNYQSISVNSATLLANDSDPDGDAVSITSVSPASTQGGTVSLTGQTILFSAAAGFAGDDTFTYVLSDARGASVTGSVTVSVSANHPPAFAPVPDMVATVLAPLILTNLATDPDLANRLTYSLGPGTPTNSYLNPTNGILRWTPTRQQAPSTNTITVIASDDGSPSLSNSVSFIVYVNDYIETTLGFAAIAVGESTNIPIDVFSSAAISDSQCILQFPSGRITNATVTALLPATASVALQQQAPDNYLLTLTAMPGQTLQGTQRLAQLNFAAVTNQSSAFVPLHISSMAGTRVAAGLTPSTLANDGRVAIVADQPLLETLPANNGNRQLMFYGKRNSTNRIQYATSLGTNVVWTNRATIIITTSNQYRVLPVGNSPPPPIFYRVASP